MALSATFTANFQSFYDAVDKASVKLGEFQGGADKAGDKLNKMAQSFSGQKVVQEATLMVKAIGGVEGITQLTEKEMARLGATTNEAVEKLKRLGKEVPKDLQAVADATKNANTQTIDWMGSLGKMAATVGIAFSVDAVTNFIGSVFDAAGAIQDLSDQWGFSTDAVQEWTAAAKLSGVESTTVGKSIQFLAGELSKGSDAYIALIDNAGLSYEKLRAMPLEDAYREVIRAIAAIKDETLQLDIAEGLIGKSAEKMIGAIRDGVAENLSAQAKMSKETIQHLADMGDAWETLWNNVIIWSGEALVGVTTALATMTSSWGTFAKGVGLALKDVATGSFGSAAAFLQMQAGLDQVTQATTATTTATTAATTATGTLGGTMLTTALVLEQRKKAEEAAKAATEARTKAIADAKAKDDAYTKALADQKKGIDALVTSFGGGGLVQKANDYLEALGRSIPVQKMTATTQADINRTMAAAIDVYLRAGQVAPKAMIDTWVQTKIATDNVVALTFKIDDLRRRYLDLTQLPKFDPLSVGTSVPLPDAPDDPDRVPRLYRDILLVTDAVGRLGDTVDGPLGDVFTMVGNIGVALNDGKVAADGMKTGLDQLGTGKTADGLSTVAASAVTLTTNFLALTEGAGVLQSIMTGAAMGASFGWIGAAVGGVYGLARGMRNADAAAGNLAQAQIRLIGSIPVWVDMTEHAEAFNAVIEANTIQELQYAWEDFSDAVEASRLRDEIIDAAGGLDVLRAAAQSAGFDIERMLTLNGDQLRQELEGLTEALQFQDQAMATLAETAERYGFTIAELGPAMQAQELDQQAQQLFQDWEVLNAAGIETIDITNRMGASVSDYVNTAMRLGFEVPNAMRPMLEAMVEAGDLTDANGDAFASLEDSGITFALTMSQGFQRLIDQVEKLTNAIARGLGLAIENVPDVNVEGRVTWRVDDVPASSTMPVGPELEAYARGTGGYMNFGTGTPVILHGWEAVVPKGDAASLATITSPVLTGSSTIAGNVTLVVEQDGKQTAQWIAPYLAGEVYRLRLA